MVAGKYSNFFLMLYERNSRFALIHTAENVFNTVKFIPSSGMRLTFEYFY